MKKIFPILNVVLLYLIAIPFVVDIEIYNDFFDKYISPIYYPALFISGILSVIYAFYLYKKQDEKNLKFSMCVSVFGLIPYYLLASLFWVIMSAFASGYNSTGAVILLAMAWMSFVLWTNAFYGFNLARLQKRFLMHKVLHFVFVANIFATIHLLRKRNAD